VGASERIAQLVTPADHFAALASEQRSDHLLWLKGRKQSNGREWYSLNREIALQELSRYTSQPDVYVTPNEFHGWRLVRLLSGLNAFYVDIDVHDGAGCPVAAAAAALERIDRARLPGPSMVVYTGRGAHLYWCFNRTPAAALPRWQRVQRTLVALTAGDKQVVDVTRVLRVVGTTNPLAAEGRKSVTGEVLNPGRYDFDWLCDQIVELPRAEIRDIRAARANKDAQDRAESRAAGKTAGSIFQVWYHRYTDLIKIADAHWFGGVPQGHRNSMLFMMATSLSWFTRSEALNDEILAVARHHMPSFSDAEIQSTVSSVIKRATDAADGKHYEWNGEKIDPRYRFTSARIWEQMKDLVLAHPELVGQLRAIVPPEVRTERRKVADAGRNRVAEGRYEASRAQTYEERRNRVLKLLVQGQSTDQIAAEIGITPRAVREYRRRLLLDESAGQRVGPQGSTSHKAARNTRVQALLEQGLSNSQIACDLGISIQAARQYVRQRTKPEPSKSLLELSTAKATEASARLVFKARREIERFRDHDWARSLLAKGYSVRQVAEFTGFSKSMVSKLSTAKATEAIAPLVCGRSPTRSVAPQGPGVVDAKR
jgi:DNA-binding CsgD family transcriptional regulator